jgi:mannose-6-phosphate isomerase-like protein (cupin superfamily)
MADAGEPTLVRMGEVSTDRRSWMLVDKARHGSEVLFGFYWTIPGEESAFSFEEVDPEIPGFVHWGPIHDVYFVLHGSIRVTWRRSGETASSSFEMGAMDTAYLPPGYNYRIKTTSREPAQVFYAAAPAAEKTASPRTVSQARVDLMHGPA